MYNKISSYVCNSTIKGYGEMMANFEKSDHIDFTGLSGGSRGGGRAAGTGNAAAAKAGGRVYRSENAVYGWNGTEPFSA